MLLQLNGIHKYYGRNSDLEVHVLRGLNLEVEEGEMIAILGRSGSGKSTLLNIIACIDQHDEGQYIFDSKDISNCTEKELADIRNRSIGFVLQDFALVNEQKVWENTMIPLLFDSRHSLRESKRHAMEQLDQLGIVELAHKRAGQLSGGQKQRVAIARALVNQPSLVVADEPSGSLDEKTAKEVMEVFTEVHQLGHTLVIVTHDSKIAEYCDKKYELSGGLLSPL